MILAPAAMYSCVWITGTDAGIFFHEHGVPVLRQLLRSGRHEADAILLLFNFLRNADDHDSDSDSDSDRLNRLDLTLTVRIPNSATDRPAPRPAFCTTAQDRA